MRRRPGRHGRAAAAAVTVACVAAVAAAGSAGTYRVQRGDTLSGVAGRLGVSIRSLASANGIRDLDHLVAGRSLTVPAGSTGSASTSSAPAATSYVVRRGDTLGRIARRFGVSTATLASVNGVRDADLVRIGQRLTIPGPSAAGAVAAAAPAVRVSGALPSRLRASPARLALMPHFDRWAAHYGVPGDLLKAMTWVESGWQNHKVSSTGAIGIGQLMPDTVDFVSDILVRAALDPRNPEHNIRMSARFLKYLLDQTGWRADSALAAYYQGLRSTRERGVFGETRQYVATVLAVRPSFR